MCDIVAPVIYAMCCAIELIRSGTLAKARFIGCWIVGIESTSNRFTKHTCVVAWTWILCELFFCVFTIRYFGKEGTGVALSIKLTLSCLINRFVLSRARILFVWQPGIFDVDSRFKKLSLVFWSLKITNGCVQFDSVIIWVVKCRTNCINITACVHVLWQFFRRNGRRLRFHFIHLISMPLRWVFVPTPVEIWRVSSEL